MEKSTEQLRNVALIAHAGSGKTSLAEAMLYNGKVTTRMGKVDDGSSNLDFEPEEIKRRTTLTTAFHHFDWKKTSVNLIDTPGDDNFISDTKLSLQAADGAIVVIDATAGVKVGTEKVWGFADQQQLPRMVFVNRMDRERADFYQTLDMISQTFETNMTPLFLPMGAEDKFAGVVDLIKMKAYTYKKDGSGAFETGDIPSDMTDIATEWREKMVENIVEANDDLMEKYLEGDPLSDQEIEETLVQGIKSGMVTPVAAGSALLNMGITQLMNLIVENFPSPLERPPKTGAAPGGGETIEREPSPDAPFSALVFKTVADPFAGKLTIMRIFSGTLQPDATVYNANKESKEKLGNLLQMEGKKQQPMGTAVSGDIVAVAKLKETGTGDTLCAVNDPILYAPVEVIPPVISYAVEAKVKGSEDKVFTSLARLLEEDPTLKLERDPYTGDVVLSGTGQLHLEATCEKLNRKFGVEVILNPVKVPYRETIKKPAKGVVYRHKKQSGGRGQFAEVHFDVFPQEPDTGFEFEEALTGMNVPRNFVPAVEKGLNEAMESGPLAGYPVVDLKVRFYDGKSHEVDSSEMAFKMAAIMCLRKAMEAANPILLEPIMQLEIIVPEEVMGDVMGDLNGRRGRVMGMDSQGKYQIIKAQAPMSEVLTYALDLNSMSGGRGTFTMEQSHYEELPAQLTEKVIAAAKQEEE
ncbi:MAG: elongation factor G [Deltaproteobacteria bacterium]|nr:elongation factor G [Deltaproteobacteria bacterium]MCF8118854.1 elongation factor G [Deltaproteobacteria bacterium]